MKTYTKWDDVPAHLATKTGLASRGLKPAPDQKPVALKLDRRHRGLAYQLYDIGLAVPVEEIANDPR